MSIKTGTFVFRLFNALVLLTLLVGAVGVTPAYARREFGGRHYVKTSATGTGDCSSWANACKLQTALAAAVGGDDIWVAAGTHKPTTGFSRTATFQLKLNVDVYGGFAGTETGFTQRDPAANVTTLSGFLFGAGNSYHVVTGATGATLDGFTITSGNANGASPNNRGGGLYNPSGSSPTLSNLIFKNNSASYGGGIYNDSSSPTLTNVTFSGNSATTYYGGGIANNDSSPTLVNVTFSGNSAVGEGGGMFNRGNLSSPVLRNVTFSGNSAAYGGGMYNFSSSSPAIYNTIFWGNTATTDGAQIYNDSSTPSVRDSVVQNGYAGGTNIITTDPMLGALGNYGGFTETIPLLPGSSAIDALTNGTNGCGTTVATDQRGVARPQRSKCDIGAYEYDYTGIYYVNPVASGTADCQGWANACTLQNALTTTINGDEIWVAAGTHKPTTGIDRSASFQLIDSVAVYGGFAGTETARNQRNPVANVTILSGEIGAAVKSDNSYHVVTGTTGATLDGFTITAGYANSASPNDRGGGMYNNSSSPTLTNVTFSDNSADYGGGMGNENTSSPTLTNVTFSGNSATSDSGGMYNNSSSPILTNVTFSGNSAADYGGGMFNSVSSPTLTNVTFSGNWATNADGGGMYNYSSSPSLTNVTFSGNSAVQGGGMENYSGSNPTLTNVTFSSNSATNGGGMHNSSSNPEIRNTIFWGNTATTAGVQIYNDSSTPVVSDSVVQDGYAGGTNIITADPLLGALGNYGGFTQTFPLLAGSSAIDTGNDDVCPATDQRGITRPQGVHCDIGAYEVVNTTIIYNLFLPLILR